ncbi:MAG: hypothetical protein HEQ39_08400 [Rhizobacter sp.]
MNVNSETAGVFIVGAGCVFPSGPRLTLADSAVRMPMALFRKHPFWVDACGQRPKVSCFPADANQTDTTRRVAEEIFGGPRWAELATAALKDMALSLRSTNGSPTTPSEPTACALWLVLPDTSTPGFPADAVRAIDVALNAPELRMRLHVQRGALVHGGHSAGVFALQQAQSFLQTQTAGQPLMAVVLAVDCPLTPAHLESLQQQNLLQGAHQRVRGDARANPYGRIPGEGAAAVALSPMPIDAIANLTKNNAAQQGNAPKTWSARYLEEAKRTASSSIEPLYRPWSQLLGIGTGQEEITWAVTQAQSKPCLGLGLTRAVFNAMEQAAQNSHHLIADNTPPQIMSITTDMNGEPYRGDELGFTLLRLAQQSSQPRSPAMPTLHEGWQRRSPVLASGDLGSASAIAHTALAAYDLHRKATTASADSAACHLVLSSSDDSLRGAVLLRALHQNSSP